MVGVGMTGLFLFSFSLYFLAVLEISGVRYIILFIF